MADLTEAEWNRIKVKLAADPQRYGLPKREYGSVVLGSFNIRKLGKVQNRSANTWDFLIQVCRQFDLLSVQEIMEDPEGLEYLLHGLGPEYQAVVSDTTGVFPGEQGLGERLGFIYNTNLVRRGPIVSDVSLDRSHLLATLVQHHKPLMDALKPHLDYLQAQAEWEKNPVGPKPKAPGIQVPVFLTFIRQPFMCSFEVVGHPGTEPYRFMGINAHLYFGNSLEDRRQEFDALIQWILARIQSPETRFPNFMLMGDLNLDFNDPVKDRPRIEEHIKTFNQQMQTRKAPTNVNFPFLDVHQGQSDPFRTNARLDETFDQIGLFSWDPRLPGYEKNPSMGSEPRGPDYGVFNFVQLFSDALLDKPIAALSADARKEFFRKFEYEVSDHMPLWLRLPLP